MQSQTVYCYNHFILLTTIVVFSSFVAQRPAQWGWAQTDHIGSIREALPSLPNPQTMRDRQRGGH